MRNCPKSILDIFSSNSKAKPNLNIEFIDTTLKRIFKSNEVQFSALPSASFISVGDIISSVDVVLITETDDKKNGYVRNRFTRLKEVYNIEYNKTQPINEQNIPLLVKCYWLKIELDEVESEIKSVVGKLKKLEADSTGNNLSAQELSQQKENEHRRLIEIHNKIEALQKIQPSSEAIRKEIQELLKKQREIHRDIINLDKSSNTKERMAQEKKNLEDLLKKREHLLDDMHDCPAEIPFGKGADSLAFYNPTHGIICMKIDAISKSFEYVSQTILKGNNQFTFELYFQYILLHEFIHAFFDITPRNIFGGLINSYSCLRTNNKWSGQSYTEESLDEFMCLKVYEQSESSNSGINNVVANIIQNSPKEYNLGYDLYSQKKDKLAEDMLAKLFLHKLK